MNIPYLSWSDNNVAQVRESLEIALGEWQANGHPSRGGAAVLAGQHR